MSPLEFADGPDILEILRNDDFHMLAILSSLPEP